MDVVLNKEILIKKTTDKKKTASTWKTFFQFPLAVSLQKAYFFGITNKQFILS